jgi:glycosyltransferase involved in cell wall biosynthesis
MSSQNNKPLVSVLLNCFNSSEFISKAIQSVIDQSYNNWELIIWDDGSTDDTVKIIKQFQDKRIKLYLANQNIGLCKSRVKATKKINGSLVSILDSDDYYHQDKLRQQVKIFEKFPSVSICATWTKTYNQNNTLLRLYNAKADDSEIKKKLIFVNLLVHSSIMYRRLSAQKVGWYSNLLEYSQDYDLTLKLIKNEDIALIRDYLTYVTLRTNNMTNSKSLQTTIIKENILILRNNLNFFSLTNHDKNTIKAITNIKLIKLNLIELELDFLGSLINLFKIFIKNPLIIFKFNLIKSIEKNLNT